MTNRLMKLFSEKFHIKSIQAIITIYFSCLIIIIVAIIGILSYYVTGNTVKNNSGEYVYQLVEQVNYNIEYYLKNVEYIADNLQYNKDIQEFFLSKNHKDKKTEAMIQEQLNAIVNARTDISSIMLVANGGSVILNNSNYKLKDNIDFNEYLWYTQALTNNELIFSGSHVQNLLVGKYDWVVSCSTLLKSPNEKQYMGVMLIDINYNLIDDMVSKIKLGEKGYVFIIAPDGDIVYHPKQQLLYNDIKTEDISLILNSEDGNKTVTEDGVKKQYTIVTSKYSGWKLVGVVYMKDIASYEPYLKRFFVIVSILAVFVAVIFAIILSANMLHPIKEILVSMNKFKEGDLDATIDIKQDNEISEIAKAFNLMTIRIKTLVIKNKEGEKAKRKFELKALQAQINPHFLYNTLDSIVWMSEVGNNKDVVEMTSSLAKLFRVSISRGKEYITVEEELAHVKSYLTIQKIRYGNKLDYDINVDETLLQIKIIKIIIQPIVENAIYHGIKNIPGQGKININIVKEKDKMIISIKDDGIGMTRETIKGIFNRSCDESIHLGGVGVRNVDERIKLNYGDEYGLKYESELNHGTIVKIILPINGFEEESIWMK